MEEEKEKDAPGDQPPNDPPPAEKPAIALRTMKSDVEDFFQKTRPSLTQIIGKGLETSKTRTEKEETRKYRLIIAVSILIIAGAGAMAFWFIQKPGNTTGPAEIEPPLAFFPTERSVTISAKANEPGQFLRNITREAKEAQPRGSIKSIWVKLEDEKTTHYITLADFFALLRISPPPRILQLGNEQTLMLFIYTGAYGPRAGFAVQVKDPERALGAFLSWEGSLQHDFQSLFLDESPAPAISIFEDHSFRNIDWRYLKLADENLGLGYGIFPIGNMLIFTTSREAMEKVITRLSDQR